jgi:membrane associated rhomboid family serine protease
MAYTERQFKERMTLGQSDNALMKLIAITLIMFVGLAFMKAVWYVTYEKNEVLPHFKKEILDLFIMPADVDKLLSKPWTLITHMFVHTSVWEVFANMLWLWSFGYIMQDLTGNKKIIPIFIYGALAGAIAFIVAYNFVPALKPQLAFATDMGAAAGVMAVAIATTMVSPNYRIFPMIRGGIPLWVLTIFYILSNVFTISVTDTANIMLHLAGALIGFLYIFSLRQGYDWGGWMNNFFDWVNNLFNPNKPKKGKSIKDELFYKASSAPYKKTPNLTQQRVDEILDKINKQGYSFLTDEEKELLKRASKEEL